MDLSDGGSSDSESTKSDEAAKKTAEIEKGQESMKHVSQAQKNPFSLTMKEITPVKRKMFSIDSLGTASKVIGTYSWLEDTLDRKRKRKDEGSPNKDSLSLAVHFGSALTNVKKQKTLSILGQDPEIGHLTMEIAKPNKEGRIEDMTIDDFTMHLVDLGEAIHDTKVGLWKSTNEVIEGQLESLKLSKVRMKAEIQELNGFISQLVTPLESISEKPITRDPTTGDVQALISQL